MKRALLGILIVLLCLPEMPAAAWEKPDYIPWEELPAGLQNMPEGFAFVQALYNGDGFWFFLSEARDGSRTLRVFREENGGFALQAESVPLPEMNGIKPSLIAGYASVSILYSEMLLYTFQPDFDGVWRLAAVQGEQTYRCTRYWLMEQDVWQGRLLYAENASPALSAFDPRQYPQDFNSAAETLTLDGYALVNNPNPADRLHLREEPSTDSRSIGKYYNGAPVKIEEDLGDWARVTVAGVEGYMMKQYLAVGAEMLNVQSAFAQLFIKPELAGQELSVYVSPDYQSALAGVSYDRGTGREEITVIGLVGDDWLHVVTGDGIAGYMPAKDFYPGNG
jgi:hypothetical protein